MRTFVALAALGLALCGGAGTASAGAGAHADSCAGAVAGWGTFTAVINQTAIVQNGVVTSETHTMVYSGFLAGMEDAPIVAADDLHIIYRSGKIDLAVPYKDGANLYFRNNSAVATPGRSGGWYRLCEM
ncbi:hypothetical protein ABZV58_13605 [Nocardia sp. NPDC004654]|uniref:hypothetical protein n=1 Tax=Nocardia sp. NPDC004654 TaxID=3154776 RepID=UPI0033B54972